MAGRDVFETSVPTNRPQRDGWVCFFFFAQQRPTVGDMCKKNKQKKQTRPVNMSSVDYSPPESSDEGFLSPITVRSGGLLSRKKKDP